MCEGPATPDTGTTLQPYQLSVHFIVSKEASYLKTMPTAKIIQHKCYMNKYEYGAMVEWQRQERSMQIRTCPSVTLSTTNLIQMGVALK
jgi:hypothetical protein